MFCILMFPLRRLPIKISCNISFVMNWILKMLNWTLSITSQGVSENIITILSIVIGRSKTPIIFQHIWISSATITLIVKSASFFVRWLGIPSCNRTIKLLQMDTCVSHSALVWNAHSSIVLYNKCVSSRPVTKVTNVFRVECSLKPSECLVGLSFSCVIHGFE